jgi:hypothetical protein
LQALESAGKGHQTAGKILYGQNEKCHIKWRREKLFPTVFKSATNVLLEAVWQSAGIVF